MNISIPGQTLPIASSSVKTGNIVDVEYDSDSFLPSYSYIAYNGTNLFVTYSRENSSFYRSTDGITWTKVTTTSLSPSSINGYPLYGNGIFLYSTNLGTITTTDGVNFNLNSNDTTVYTQYESGVGFIGTNNYKVVTNVDGNTPIETVINDSAETDYTYRPIVFTNGYYKMIGFGKNYISTDLTNWTYENNNLNTLTVYSPSFYIEKIVTLPNGTLIGAVDYSNQLSKIAFSEGGLYKSVDYGVTWTKISSADYYIGSDNLKPMSLSIRGTTIYVVTDRVAHYSDDEGATWNSINIPAEIVSFAYDKKNNIILASDRTITSNRPGTVYSKDGGKTWKILYYRESLYSGLVYFDDATECFFVCLGGVPSFTTSIYRIPSSELLYDNRDQFSGGGNLVQLNLNFPASSTPYAGTFFTRIDNTLFVAFTQPAVFSVTYNNRLYYSNNNGLTWNQGSLTTGIGKLINIVKTSDGNIYGIGEYGTTKIQNATHNWTIKELSLPYAGVAKSNQNVLVAASAYGLHVSFDNSTWDQIFQHLQFNSIKYVNGRFLASTYDSHEIFESTDGINWNIYDSASNYTSNQIYYVNGVYFKLGNYNSAIIIQTSTDGLNWTVRKTVTPAGNTVWDDVIRSGSMTSPIWTGSKYVIIASRIVNNSPDENKIYTIRSSDLINWSIDESTIVNPKSLNNWSFTNIPSNLNIYDYFKQKFVHYNGAMFLPINNANQLFKSVDEGITWNLVEFDITGITLDGTYHDTGNIGTYNSFNIANNKLIFFSQKVVIDAFGNTKSLNVIFTSDDGVNWSRVHHYVSNLEYASSIYWNGSYYFFNTAAPSVYRSPDLINWTVVNSGFQNYNDNIYTEADGKIVSFSSGYANLQLGGNIRISSDNGVTWTTNTFSTASIITGYTIRVGNLVKIANNTYRVFGYYNTVYETTDSGATWNLVSDSTKLVPYDWNQNDMSFEYFNGEYYIAFHDTGIVLKTNTQNFNDLRRAYTAHTSWTDNSDNGEIYNLTNINGRLAFSGRYGSYETKLYYSTDATNWTTYEFSGETFNYYKSSIYWNGSVYVFKPNGNKIYTSANLTSWTQSTLTYSGAPYNPSCSYITPSVMLIGYNGNRYAVSTDNGANWSTVGIESGSGYEILTLYTYSNALHSILTVSTYGPTFTINSSGNYTNSANWQENDNGWIAQKSIIGENGNIYTIGYEQNIDSTYNKTVVEIRSKDDLSIISVIRFNLPHTPVYPNYEIRDFIWTGFDYVLVYKDTTKIYTSTNLSTWTTIDLGLSNSKIRGDQVSSNGLYRINAIGLTSDSVLVNFGGGLTNGTVKNSLFAKRSLSGGSWSIIGIDGPDTVYANYNEYYYPTISVANNKVFLDLYNYSTIQIFDSTNYSTPTNITTSSSPKQFIYNPTTNTYISMDYNGNFYLHNSDFSTQTSIGAIYGDGYYQSVFVKDGVFVATDTSSVYTSTDGLTWTNRLTLTGYCRLQYANTSFIFGSNDGNLYTSTDGISWTSRISTVLPRLVSSALYISSSNLWTLRSTYDSSIWTSSSLSGPWTKRVGTIQSWNGVTVNGNNAIAQSLYSNSLDYTLDGGITWSSSTTSIYGAPKCFYSSALSKFIFYTSSGILSTTNGSSFTTNTHYNSGNYPLVSIIYPSGAGVEAIYHGRNTSVGSTSTSYQICGSSNWDIGNRFLNSAHKISSSDLANWTVISEKPNINVFSYSSVDDYYMAIGAYPISNSLQVYQIHPTNMSKTAVGTISAKYVHWVKRTTSYWVTLVTDTGGTPRIYYSSDGGANWTLSATSVASIAGNITAIPASVGNTIVFAASPTTATSTNATLISSTNGGVTWTITNIATYLSFGYVNGGYNSAVYTDGTIFIIASLATNISYPFIFICDVASPSTTIRSLGNSLTFPYSQGKYFSEATQALLAMEIKGMLGREYSETGSAFSYSNSKAIGVRAFISEDLSEIVYRSPTNTTAIPTISSQYARYAYDRLNKRYLEFFTHFPTGISARSLSRTNYYDGANVVTSLSNTDFEDLSYVTTSSDPESALISETNNKLYIKGNSTIGSTGPMWFEGDLSNITNANSWNKFSAGANNYVTLNYNTSYAIGVTSSIQKNGNTYFTAIATFNTSEGSRVIYSDNNGENWYTAFTLGSSTSGIVPPNVKYYSLIDRYVVCGPYYGFAVSNTNSISGTWTKYTSSSYAYFSMEYNGAIYVFANYLYKSTDGVSWTIHSTFSPNTALEAATNGATWICAAGTMSRRSTNEGSSWVAMSTYLRSVAYMSSLSRWIGVNTSNQLVYSNDNGVTWTTCTIGGNNGFFAAQNNPYKVILASNGKAYCMITGTYSRIPYESSDGITYTPVLPQYQNVGAEALISDTNSRLYTITKHETGAISYWNSIYTGVRWITTNATRSISSAMNFGSVPVYNTATGYYYAIGRNAGNTNSVLMRSSDGITWSEWGTPSWSNQALSNVRYLYTPANGTWLLSISNQLYTSTNLGVSWQFKGYYLSSFAEYSAHNDRYVFTSGVGVYTFANNGNILFVVSLSNYSISNETIPIIRYSPTNNKWIIAAPHGFRLEFGDNPTGVADIINVGTKNYIGNIGSEPEYLNFGYDSTTSSLYAYGKATILKVEIDANKIKYKMYASNKTDALTTSSNYRFGYYKDTIIKNVNGKIISQLIISNDYIENLSKGVTLYDGKNYTSKTSEYTLLNHWTNNSNTNIAYAISQESRFFATSTLTSTYLSLAKYTVQV